MKIESYATLALVTAFASVAGTGCLKPEMMKMPLRQKVLSHCGVTVFSDRCERLSERQREKLKEAIEDILFFQYGVVRNGWVGMDDSEVLGRFGKNASIRILKGEEFPPVPPTEEFQERYAGVRLKEMHYRYPNGSEELFWLREENRKWKVVENVSNKCGYKW